jgi:hypothetical protein
MKHNPDLKTYNEFGLSLRLTLGLVVLGLLFLIAALPLATAFGPPNAPNLGQRPVPNAGWEAQEIGAIQPWWQMGRVEPPPATSRPWVKPPPMYDTDTKYNWGY